MSGGEEGGKQKEKEEEGCLWADQDVRRHKEWVGRHPSRARGNVHLRHKEWVGGQRGRAQCNAGPGLKS